MSADDSVSRFMRAEARQQLVGVGRGSDEQTERQVAAAGARELRDQPGRAGRRLVGALLRLVGAIGQPVDLLRRRGERVAGQRVLLGLDLRDLAELGGLALEGDQDAFDPVDLGRRRRLVALGVLHVLPGRVVGHAAPAEQGGRAGRGDQREYECGRNEQCSRRPPRASAE